MGHCVSNHFNVFPHTGSLWMGHCVSNHIFRSKQAHDHFNVFPHTGCLWMGHCVSNHIFRSLIACGRSGNLMSLICWGMFIFLIEEIALVGAAAKPASSFSILFCSSILSMISDMLVSSTIP